MSRKGNVQSSRQHVFTAGGILCDVTTSFYSKTIRVWSGLLRKRVTYSWISAANSLKLFLDTEEA